VVLGVLASVAALGACGGDSASSHVTLPPLTTSNATTVASQSSTGSGSTTTSSTTGSSSGSRVRVCDSHPGVKCIDIRSIAIDGNSFVIEWDARNFTPDVKGFHAHFFWDTYSPKQAGTNAAKFGATVGKWELTDKQPFRSEDEMRVANRPPAAKQVCVTVGDSSHALVDPSIFDCIPIPSS
jgi:hypothetical protein